MVKAVREAEKAIGEVDYELTEKQKAGRNFSRSLYVVQSIEAGETITNENIRSIRPGFGLHPKYLKDIMGRQVNADLNKGDRFDLSHIKD